MTAVAHIHGGKVLITPFLGLLGYVYHFSLQNIDKGHLYVNITDRKRFKIII